ncbi:aspartate 1-decarboxylase [bacterium B17]|nr:aspartate 1-decarboxylase [bacterium B17]
MLITMMKSKIHMAVLTETVLQYSGSITIPADLMEEANLLAGERVQIANERNGERLETYVIEGKRGDGKICLNGPAAHKGEPGDRLVIISYCIATEEEAKALEPVVLVMDENNNISERK